MTERLQMLSLALHEKIRSKYSTCQYIYDQIKVLNDNYEQNLYSIIKNVENAGDYFVKIADENMYYGNSCCNNEITNNNNDKNNIEEKENEDHDEIEDDTEEIDNKLNTRNSNQRLAILEIYIDACDYYKKAIDFFKTVKNLKNIFMDKMDTTNDLDGLILDIEKKINDANNKKLAWRDKHIGLSIAPRNTIPHEELYKLAVIFPENNSLI
ncbi:unnamed protein product [Didymodactylos carnosus]|uniref:Uncharacterized protein n=1 Tax=Didymodactylos carnosus TaxID=1234261 RepID=A0A816BHY8_9BILA|nr:unnamed protein product [Didymodactylos carnosus]CAF4489923.1 unnamed protein product [Didymodactylos carnosus]